MSKLIVEMEMPKEGKWIEHRSWGFCYASPLYELDCIECKSVILYKARDVNNHHITCPVCGVLNWANTLYPVEDKE